MGVLPLGIKFEMMKTDNELVAEFMGVTETESTFDSYSIPVPCFYTKNEFHRSNTFTVPDKSFTDWISGAKYDTSWDWLMPVVEKIEGLYFYGHLTKNTHDGRHYMSFITKDCDTVAYSSPGQTKIESVYKAVVTFIAWYNTQKQS